MSEYNGYENVAEPKTKPKSKTAVALETFYYCLGYGSIVFAVIILGTMFFNNIF